METNQGAIQQTPITEYETITYEGKPARRYPNGIIRSPKGYVLFLPRDVALKTREQGVAKARISAEDALMKQTGSRTPEEGWGKIIAAKIDVALTDKGRAGNDAARLVGIALGYIRRDTKTEIEGRVQHTTNPELPPKYLEYIEKLANRDVIDGKVIEDKPAKAGEA